MDATGLNVYRLPWGHLAAYHKAGCQSVQQVMKQHRVPQVGAAEVRGPVVIFFRHPRQRLASAWRYFRTKAKFPGNVPRGCSWVEFVDGVLDKGWRDPHWWPVAVRQNEALRDASPIIRLPFEEMAEVWSLLVPFPLPHLNASDPGDASAPHREEELAKLYEWDRHAWAGARLNYRHLTDTLDVLGIAEESRR